MQRRDADDVDALRALLRDRFNGTSLTRQWLIERDEPTGPRLQGVSRPRTDITEKLG